MIDWLHSLEIVITYFVQSLGGWLETPMHLFSFMGTDNFYMFIMPALYWCIDSRLGLRLGAILLLSNGVNSALKLAFHSPRPYWVDANVNAYAAETSFGLPSGHAQNAASLWGLLAASLRKPVMRWLLLALIFFIGFSRIFLGVHFTSDVLLGWALGGLLLWAFLRAEKPITTWAKTLSLARLLGVILLTSILWVFAIILVRLGVEGWQIPTAWNTTALAKTSAGIDPLDVEGAFTLGGTWLGLLGGAAWLARRRGFLPSNAPRLHLILRYVVGLVGVVALYFGLGQVFPHGGDLTSLLLRFVRYTLIGVWISALAPLLFARLGWAKSTP